MSKRKIKKEEVVDVETTGPPINPALADIQKINTPKKSEPTIETAPKVEIPIRSSDEPTTRQSINLVVNPNLIFQFEQILNKFKGKTEAYFSYPSKVQLFETGCIYLEKNFKEKGMYFDAPNKFVLFVSRKGKRPQSEERDVRKGSGKAMFLNLTPDTITIYYNLIYSFLKDKNDIGNEYYSASYFFFDFVNLLENNFEALCQYERDFPRD